MPQTRDQCCFIGWMLVFHWPPVLSYNGIYLLHLSSQFVLIKGHKQHIEDAGVYESDRWSIMRCHSKLTSQPFQTIHLDILLSVLNLIFWSEICIMAWSIIITHLHLYNKLHYNVLPVISQGDYRCKNASTIIKTNLSYYIICCFNKFLVASSKRPFVEHQSSRTFPLIARQFIYVAARPMFGFPAIKDEVTLGYWWSSSAGMCPIITVRSHHLAL